MKFQFRQRDRRALLGLVAAAGAYFVFSTLVFPRVDRLKEASSAVVEKEEQLRKYRQALQRKGHYEQLLVQARKNVKEAEARLIRGDSPSIASVELQTLVDEAGKRTNLEFVQKNVSAPRKKDDYFNEITMTVSFDSTLNQLTTFLADLRNSAKFITVRNMQVSPIETATAPPKKGEFKKFVRVSLTIGATLSTPEKKG